LLAPQSQLQHKNSRKHTKLSLALKRLSDRLRKAHRAKRKPPSPRKRVGGGEVRLNKQKD
jgi:hypothetical protein